MSQQHQLVSMKYNSIPSSYTNSIDHSQKSAALAVPEQHPVYGSQNPMKVGVKGVNSEIDKFKVIVLGKDEEESKEGEVLGADRLGEVDDSPVRERKRTNLSNMAKAVIEGNHTALLE